MIEYDKANVTSSYPMLTEFEVATILDRAYLALIWQKVSGNNTRRVPFEYDQKAISDIQPLICTVKHNLTVPATRIASNVVTTNLPADCLSFIDLVLEQNKSDYPLDELHQRNVPTTLIPHNTVENFLVTPYNMPWIKKPVCFLESNNVNIAYDTISLGTLGSNDKALITYIKQPISFVKSLVNYVPTDEDYQNLLTLEDAYELFVRKWQDVYTGDGPSETIPTDPNDNQGGQTEPTNPGGNQDPTDPNSGNTDPENPGGDTTDPNDPNNQGGSDPQDPNQGSGDDPNSGTGSVEPNPNIPNDDELQWVDLIDPNPDPNSQFMQATKTLKEYSSSAGETIYSINTPITPTIPVYGIQITKSRVDPSWTNSQTKLNIIEFCTTRPTSDQYKETRWYYGNTYYKEYTSTREGVTIRTQNLYHNDQQTGEAVNDGVYLYMARLVSGSSDYSCLTENEQNNTVTWLAKNDDRGVECVYLYQMQPQSFPEHVKVLIKKSDAGRFIYKWTV